MEYRKHFQIKFVDLGFTTKVSLQNFMFPLKVADSLWKAKKIVTEFNQM
jgi:UDP-N-acetylglucosamine--N-acetylmuramyl-(pentapeptide) pyrophosphoryl-undecaprenol N-acetylglucosamine transferase